MDINIPLIIIIGIIIIIFVLILSKSDKKKSNAPMDNIDNIEIEKQKINFKKYYTV